MKLSPNEVSIERRLPVGAEVVPGRGVAFRVWASQRTSVAVVIEAAEGAPDAIFRLSREGDGYFSGVVADARAGTRYRFRLDDDATLYPDPASRFQPDGPHGPSQVVDPSQFRWTDRSWRGPGLKGAVIYELHIGTFTAAGDWRAAARELPELAALGITMIELMPVSEFPGRFGWGYDGVDLYAPSRLYGTPDDFRHFVDRAHDTGLAVILDVVYNHLGPDGCYVGAFSRDYFTDRYENEWGMAINFDGDNAGPVREFFVSNAGYWVDEFHLDGLRLDATQQIFDASPCHVVAEITDRVRRSAAGRATFVVAENEPQDVAFVRPAGAGGYGLDALWNDDFHHSAMVAATGHSEAYYADYTGSPQELVSALKWGYLYQGQWNPRQQKTRGTPALNLPPARFVNYLQNHDQIANSATGARLHQLTSPGRYRALTTLLLLAPQSPMLFQGQEFAASSPFLFFADHEPDLAAAVRSGRAEFMNQFPSVASPAVGATLADPAALDTFERCRLDLSERERHADAYALHRDLLRLRRADPVFSAPRAGGIDAIVLGSEACCVRYFALDGRDRLLLLNLGADLAIAVAALPLLAPPAAMRWELLWSSEDPAYGGSGTAPIDQDGGWRLPGHAAVVLAARDPESANAHA